MKRQLMRIRIRELINHRIICRIKGLMAFTMLSKETKHPVWMSTGEEEGQLIADKRGIIIW